MKKITLNIALLSIFSLFVFTSFSQTGSYEIRIVENDLGYLDVQMREMTGGTNLPSNTDGDGISDLTFAIRWSDAFGTDIAFLCSPNPYNLTDPSGIVQTDQAGWHYRYFNANNTPYVVPDDWAYQTWQTIGTFVTVGGSGSGTFEIAPQNFGISTLNFEIGENNLPPYVQYLPTINGAAVNYTYPTLVYDYVWVGGTITPPFYNGNSWGNPANWEDACGTTHTAAPSVSSNAYIPGGLSSYPTNIFDPAANFAGTGVADNVLIDLDATVTIGNTSHIDALDFAGNLSVYGELYIAPDGEVTVDGNTYLDADMSLVVQATVDGIGSFIDNGSGTTITYGTNGSADVQTFLYHGNPVVGSLYFHQVGPTVDDPAQTYSGVTLEAFNLNDVNDFAYTFDEPSGSWVNIWQYSTPVHTGSGMMITANNSTDYTINMVGHLLTGSVSPDPLTSGGSSYEMISNPYPSAIDFDLFYANTGNSGVISNKNWVWDETNSGGNYLARAGGAGGVQNVQVGQAFFVETIAGGSVSFENSNRVHSTDPFRDVMTNILTLRMSSTATTFADELVIRFEDGATTGYDEAIEAIKWNSMYEDAAMIRSIAEDGTELSVNVMPELDLQGETVSVPVNFQTGIEGEYTITASDLESFEYGTEIWIEDKLDGNQWHNISVGHDTYTFTATADDPHDRFIIHFFGPLGVDQFTAKNVLIYADFEYALIRNMTKNEIVKEISIYSLAGTMIMHKQVPEQNMYRFYVSSHDNFYIVRVVTDKNIYTEKIFVH